MRLAGLALALGLACGGLACAEELSRAQLESAVAAGQASPGAFRQLGEFYASGRDGRKDRTEAVRLWKLAAEAGDARAPILLADRFSDEIFGRAQPNGFRVRTGRMPRAKAEEALHWYRLAFERDDRPDARGRAQVLAISIEMTLKEDYKR